MGGYSIFLLSLQLPYYYGPFLCFCFIANISDVYYVYCNTLAVQMGYFCPLKGNPRINKAEYDAHMESVLFAISKSLFGTHKLLLHTQNNQSVSWERLLPSLRIIFQVHVLPTSQSFPVGSSISRRVAQDWRKASRASTWL